MNKKWRMAAVILLAAGAILFAGAFAASGYDFSVLDLNSYETNTYVVEEPFENVEISLATEDLTVLPADDGVCRVIVVQREGKRHTVAVENGALKIAAEGKGSLEIQWPFSLRSPSVTVYLPAEECGLWRIESSTGNVSIPGGFSLQSLSVTTSTGDVSCGASVSGTLAVKTSTGNVAFNGADAGEITVATSTGNVSCGASVSGALAVKTSTGNVAFNGADAGEMTVATSTGDVTGTLRSEKVFYVKTSTGTVNVPDTTGGGACRITTSTGDVLLTITGR